MRNFTAFLPALLLLASCQTAPSDMPTVQPGSVPVVPVPTPAAMGHPHDELAGDPFADVKQVSAADSSRSHVCGKLRFDVMGQVLQSRGVSLPTTLTGLPATSAAVIYRTAAASLGRPDYTLLVGEGTNNTTGGLIRLLDLLLAAGDELIANLATSAACKGSTLFNGDGTCNADGFACLTGAALSGPQLALCNTMAKDPGFSDASAARRLTVAAVLGTTMPCD